MDKFLKVVTIIGYVVTLFNCLVLLHTETPDHASKIIKFVTSPFFS